MQFESVGAFGVKIEHLREDKPLDTARVLKLLNPATVFPIVVTNGDLTIAFPIHAPSLDVEDKTEFIEVGEILFKDQDAES